MVLGPRARWCQFRRGLRARAAVGAASLGLAAALLGEAPNAQAARPVATIERPDEALFSQKACSDAAPVCVHAAQGVGGPAALRALGAGERALRIVDALAMPGPWPDGGRGGSAAFDVYLRADDAPPAFAIDVDSLGEGLDRASAFAVIGAGPRASRGCALEGAVTRAVGFALSMRFDAGMEDGATSLLASYLEDLTGACPVEVLQAVDDYQGRPELALARGDATEADGALLFPHFLDQTFGAGTPGDVLGGLLAVSAQRTPPDALDFVDEPDFFDALRNNLRVRSERVDKALLDFAVARAFVGTRDDGLHLDDVARFGDAGRVRVEWDVPFASLPRRLAPMRPVDPTGTVYFWLDLRGAQMNEEVTFQGEWEAGVLFRWALVKVDETGAERGRVEPAAMNGSMAAQATVIGLGGLAGLLVVGVNAGSIDRSHPYDPDEEHHPSGCTVRFER
jgi:hypothetical protein